jgi:hypothetical protein
MTFFASVNVLRGGTALQGGTTVRDGIQVQIDNLLLEEAVAALGSASKASPFDVYQVYVFWATSPTMIQVSDLLIDLKALDPKTNNQPMQYRVIGNPSYYSDDHHMELKAIRIVGV